jgi:hypothetical protein
MACAAPPPRLSSNCRRHALTVWLSVGVNFHFLAASSAKRLKNPLASLFSRVCAMTFPLRSTVTRTGMVTRPWIDLRVLRERMGISW